MRTRKNRLAFYSIAAVLVCTTTIVGGWLINESMNRTQVEEKKETARNEHQVLLDKYFNNALSYMQNKQYPQAVLVWNELLLINDSIPEVHVNQGFSLFEMGHIEPASKHFQRALELNSYQINAYYGLAICFEKMEDMESAMGAMRSYIHLADDNDPFVRKAQSALWEWENDLKSQRAADSPADTKEDNSPVN